MPSWQRGGRQFVLHLFQHSFGARATRTADGTQKRKAILQHELEWVYLDCQREGSPVWEIGSAKELQLQGGKHEALHRILQTLPPRLQQGNQLQEHFCSSPRNFDPLWDGVEQVIDHPRIRGVTRDLLSVGKKTPPPIARIQPSLHRRAKPHTTANGLHKLGLAQTRPIVVPSNPSAQAIGCTNVRRCTWVNPFALAHHRQVQDKRAITSARLKLVPPRSALKKEQSIIASGAQLRTSATVTSSLPVKSETALDRQ